VSAFRSGDVREIWHEQTKISAGAQGKAAMQRLQLQVRQVTERDLTCVYASLRVCRRELIYCVVAG